MTYPSHSTMDIKEFWKNSILKVETPRFVPFRDNNILERYNTSFFISDPNLKIHATSAFYPLFAGIVQNTFDPDCFVEMVTLDKVSTNVGFQSLADGKIDLLCTTVPNEDQMETLKRSQKKLNFVAFAKEPLAFLLNTANDIDNLTIEQIKNCYEGKYHSWSEIGGDDALIHTYQLEKGNGSQSAFEKIVIGNAIDENHREVPTMPGIVDCVASDEDGICYTYWSYYSKMYANRLTKMAKVEGKDVTSPEYPLMYDIFLVYDTDNPNKNVSRLVDFILSEEGQKLVNICNRCQRTVK